MKLTRRSSMVPFLSLRSGEFFWCRIIDDTDVDIRGDIRAVLVLDIYLGGPSADGLPGTDDLVGALSNTPIRSMIGKGKALADSLSEMDGGIGKFVLLHYAGKKTISGGKSFNQWEVSELEFTVDELKKYNINPLPKKGK